MRLARFRHRGESRCGLAVEGGVRPVPGAGSIVEAGALARAGVLDEPIDIGDVVLECPVFPLVRNVFCVGWNYVDHFAEGAAARGSTQELPDRPTFFTKATTAIIGSGEPIASHPQVTETLDWEVELAVVIGVRATDVSEDQALDAVLGFTVANDVTARNVQRGHGGQWFRGKSLDATSPIGPWVVTPDELGELGPQAIECRVNGETVQSATLSDLHFGVPRIIAELSAGLTLLPGDVILTGTPSGVGFARTPPRYLSPGDVVESEIAGIGRLRNTVR